MSNRLVWESGFRAKRYSCPLRSDSSFEVGQSLYDDIGLANQYFGAALVDHAVIELSRLCETAWSIKNELRLGSGQDTTHIKIIPLVRGLKIGVNRERTGYMDRGGLFPRREVAGSQYYWLQTFVENQDLTRTIDGILADSRLGARALPQGKVRPAKRLTERWEFERDREVQEWILENANGVCESCGKTAPFVDSDGKPYLEVHHVTPLAVGGEDTIWNAVAICPNCHRRCHHGIDSADLQDRLQERLQMRLRA